MLSRLFTSKTRTALLNELLFAKKPAFVRELARKTHIPPPMVSRELKNLETAGLIRREKKGSLCLFETKSENPAIPVLRELFLQNQGPIAYLRAEVPKIQGIACAVVFGSAAKGELEEHSDIDLLVIGEVNERELLNRITLGEKKFHREINYILWTLEEWREKVEKKIPLAMKIKKGKVLALVGTQDALERLAQRGSNGKDSAESRILKKRAETGGTRS